MLDRTFSNNGYLMRLTYNPEDRIYKGRITNYSDFNPIEFFGDTVNEVLELFNDWANK